MTSQGGGKGIGMIQRPTAIGIILCEQAIVAKGTDAVTLVNCFHRLWARSFPTPRARFVMATELTDGLGTWDLTQLIACPDTLEPIFLQTGQVRFTDPLARHRSWVRVDGLSFPIPGRYQVSMLANGEPVAQCVLQLIQRGNP
jgi:hypothetical protein